MKSKLISLCALFVLALPTLAQEAPPVSVELTALSMDGSAFSTNLQSGDQVIPWEVNSNFRTRPAKYLGAPRIELFTMRAGEDGTMVRELQAAAELPTELNGRRVLVLLSKDHREGGADSKNGDGNLPYQMSFVDDDPSRFPGGSYYFFNKSRHRIGLSLGDRVEQLEPGTERIIRPTAGRESEIEVKVAHGVDKEWHWVRSYSTILRPDRRFLVFLTDSGNQRRPVRFHSVADYLSENP